MARRASRHPAAVELRSRIAERLREAQAESGLKNEELARQIGISVRLVQKHRAGHNTPDWENLLAYARILGKPVTWFLDGKVAA